MGARSMSTGAPAAMVEASGFICWISGTSVAAAPTAPTVAVAIKRKSRRVGSADDIAVTFLPPLPVLRSFRPDLRSGQDWPHVAAEGFASGLGKVRSDGF